MLLELLHGKILSFPKKQDMSRFEITLSVSEKDISELSSANEVSIRFDRMMRTLAHRK
jgi:hypothetical protein